MVKLDCAGCKPLFYQTGIKFSYAYLINFGNLRFSYVGIPDGIIPGSQIVASGAFPEIGFVVHVHLKKLIQCHVAPADVNAVLQIALNLLFFFPKF